MAARYTAHTSNKRKSTLCIQRRNQDFEAQTFAKGAKKWKKIL